MDFFELVKTRTSQSVQAAIKRGAKVDARDNNGWTQLMWATAFNQNPEVITTLLAAGADPKAHARVWYRRDSADAGHHVQPESRDDHSAPEGWSRHQRFRTNQLSA